MKQANRTAPNTHSKEEVASEVAKLRLLMSKWNKRALVPPSKSQKAHQSEEALENDPIGCRAEPADPLLQLRRAVLAQVLSIGFSHLCQFDHPLACTAGHAL
jgi:hypothetical protein